MWPDLTKASFHTHNDKAYSSPPLNFYINELMIHVCIVVNGSLVGFLLGLVSWACLTCSSARVVFKWQWCEWTSSYSPLVLNHYPFTFNPCWCNPLYSLYNLSLMSECSAVLWNCTHFFPFLLLYIVLWFFTHHNTVFVFRLNCWHIRYKFHPLSKYHFKTYSFCSLV